MPIGAGHEGGWSFGNTSHGTASLASSTSAVAGLQWDPTYKPIQAKCEKKIDTESNHWKHSEVNVKKALRNVNLHRPCSKSSGTGAL